MLQWLEEKNLFTALLFIIFPIFILIVRRVWSQKKNLPPSPPKLPLIGNLHQLSKLVHRSLRDLSDKYGPLMLLHFGGEPVIVITSPEIVKEIATTHGVAFSNRPFLTAPNKLFYGCTDIGFAPYGEFWRYIRKITVSELLSPKKAQSFKFVREEEVALLIQNLRNSEGNPVILAELLLSLTNNIVSRCTLGRKQEARDGENKLGDLTREFMQLLGAFNFTDLFPWLGWIDRLSGLLGRMEKVSGELYAFIDKIIDEHLMEQKDYDSDDKLDFVDMLLQIQQDQPLHVKLTRNNIKAILMDMFVGGTDTTTTTSEWAMAELVKHPNVMKKAQEEVRRIAGKKSKVDEDDISEMHYLKAVIKETLRLHPAGPLLAPRENSIATNLEGYNIPSKTKIIINGWAIQRDPKIWDNAEEFIPERFLDSPMDYKGRDYQFIPFGFGRRICPGMSFAVPVVELAIANLLYLFDWELPGGASNEELDMTEAVGIAVHMKFPLQIVAKSHIF